MRKDYFNDETDGYFKKEKRESPPSNPMGGKANLSHRAKAWNISFQIRL